MLRQFVYLFVLGLFMFTNVAVAQIKGIVEFSGFIRATGTDIEVPYVTITNTSYGSQTFISNHEGFFSFVAHKGDVIQFESVGYQKFTFTIPEDISGDRYSANLEMESLVEELPIVTVGPPLPWASVAEFTAEFLAMRPGYDEVTSAKRNLSPEALASLALILPRTADEIQTQSFNNRHVGMSNKHTVQNAFTPLTNPFAWGQLINSIKKGDFSRKKLKY